MNFITNQNNKTISTDMPQVVRLTIAQKKLVFNVPVTSGLTESELNNEEVFDEKHIKMITKARQEYKNGEVISEKELFKRLEKDANRDG
ncbi:hypothetical protein ISS85_04015 [Candidatus Microgenomates bacterium]|nr:hypothetical protein [Candidatus Microgenomates bacterium]